MLVRAVPCDLLTRRTVPLTAAPGSAQVHDGEVGSVNEADAVQLVLPPDAMKLFFDGRQIKNEARRSHLLHAPRARPPRNGAVRAPCDSGKAVHAWAAPQRSAVLGLPVPMGARRGAGSRKGRWQGRRQGGRQEEKKVMHGLRATVAAAREKARDGRATQPRQPHTAARDGDIKKRSPLLPCEPTFGRLADSLIPLEEEEKPSNIPSIYISATRAQ
jgi:hypothetical protein